MLGDLGSGRGSDAELRRASSATLSRWVCRLGSRSAGAARAVAVGPKPGVRGGLPGDFAGCALPCVFCSGKLAMRVSFARLGRLLPAFTVCEQVGRFMAGVVG